MDVPAAPAGLETFIERARALHDEDRLALADARGAIDEAFHAGAWKAASAIVMERAHAYLDARLRIGTAHIPDKLEELVALGSQVDTTELARWQDVARLVRTAIDDALLAQVGVDLIRPPDLRELYGPWRAMLEAAHQRSR